jgi:hypothetical protein
MGTGVRTGMTIARSARTFLLCLVSLYLLAAFLGGVTFATDQQTQKQTQNEKQNQKKTKKQQAAPLPPLPSGPTGPVPQVSLENIAPVPPQVSYENGQLTIVAPNSTLGDILKAVRKQTGAEIDIPDARERVVTRLGPGPARDVIADLLNGSRFNYVMLGSPDDGNALTRIVLVAKTGPDNPPPQPSGLASARHPNDVAQQPAQDGMAETADEPEDNAAEENNNNDQTPPPAEAEQQSPPASDQPATKTPQQLLQEMQQRQLQMQQQLQQQQQSGQPQTPPGQPPQQPPQ